MVKAVKSKPKKNYLSFWIFSSKSFLRGGTSNLLQCSPRVNTEKW